VDGGELAGGPAGRYLPAGVPPRWPGRAGAAQGLAVGPPAALAVRCRARDRPIRYRCAGCATDCGGPAAVYRAESAQW